MSHPSLRELLSLAAEVYAYSDDDKEIIRHMAETDKPGLELAMRSDLLLNVEWECRQSRYTSSTES